MRLFPEARVVHLFRDGRECALSMSGHARYKLAAVRSALRSRLGYDPYASGDGPDDGAEVGQGELAGLIPGQITRARLERFEVPLSRYGAMWSKMILDGMSSLPDQSRLLTLDYRDLANHPAESIARFLDFLGLEGDAARDRQLATTIRRGRDVRSEVGEQLWKTLGRACRLGMNHLYGRDGWT
jgi:putative sulfotransferase